MAETQKEVRTVDIESGTVTPVRVSIVEESKRIYLYLPAKAYDLLTLPEFEGKGSDDRIIRYKRLRKADVVVHRYPRW